MHALLLCMLCGCGRTNLGRTDGSSGRDDSGGFPGAEGNGREGGHPNVASTSDTGQPDGSVDVISSPDSRVDARDGPVGDGRTKADSCVPITCTPEGGSYCGLIGMAVVDLSIAHRSAFHLVGPVSGTISVALPMNVGEGH